MKTHALQFPVFVEEPGRGEDPGTSQAISALLPGVKARIDTAPGDFIFLEASSLTASSMTASSMTASSMTEAPPIARTQRLVVLIPENEFDENELARRIWRLANPGSLDVLLLSILPEPETEAYQRLRLVTLASSIRREPLQVGVSLAGGKNWLEAVRGTWRAGDLLVCLQGHKSALRFRPGQDLVQQPSASLAAPVYALGGLRLGPSLRQVRRRKDWAAWTGFLGTLASFGWIQLLINRATVGNLWTLLMALSVLMEIAILWAINVRTQ